MGKFLGVCWRLALVGGFEKRPGMRALLRFSFVYGREQGVVGGDVCAFRRHVGFVRLLLLTEGCWASGEKNNASAQSQP